MGCYNVRLSALDGLPGRRSVSNFVSLPLPALCWVAVHEIYIPTSPMSLTTLNFTSIMVDVYKAMGHFDARTVEKIGRPPSVIL